MNAFGFTELRYRGSSRAREFINSPCGALRARSPSWTTRWAQGCKYRSAKTMVHPDRLTLIISHRYLCLHSRLPSISRHILHRLRCTSSFTIHAYCPSYLHSTLHQSTSKSLSSAQPRSPHLSCTARLVFFSIAKQEEY
jgi:hypothetical protein